MSKKRKTTNKISPSIPMEFKLFDILPEAPSNHKYYNCSLENIPLNIIQKENKILQDCLPPNIWVRTYEDKINLYSIMISGPGDTPYEHGIFLFDAVLPKHYPDKPPLFHYHSFCNGRINPNIYTSGLVCLSLLGTWGGTGCEQWKKESTILQVLVSIQGLILVKEPYYNEPGYTKNYENSKRYNVKTVIRVIMCTIAIMKTTNNIFDKEIRVFINDNKKALLDKIASWVSNKSPYGTRKRTYSQRIITSYPFLPLKKSVHMFKGLENLLKLQLEKYKT